MRSAMIAAVVVDDHALVRDGVRNQLSQTHDIALVGEGSCGEQIIELVEKHRPDVLLLDLELPHRAGEKVQNGAERFRPLPMIRHLCHHYRRTRILVVSMHLHRRIVEQLINEGASGYLLKSDIASQRLSRAIRVVHAGGLCISSDVQKALSVSDYLVPFPDMLTSTQQHILSQFIRYPDLSMYDRAERLGITWNTLRNHIRDIKERLGVRTVNAAVVRGIQMGLVSVSYEGFAVDDFDDM